MPTKPFHLAIPVNDLAAARAFYGTTLGCAEGRSTDHWIDFDFFGHQLVVHRVEGGRGPGVASGGVDGHAVPVPHFGVVLDLGEWDDLAKRLRQRGIQFKLEPQTRFVGQPGEQATMFFLDPSGNAIEIKAFKDLSRLFART